MLSNDRPKILLLFKPNSLSSLKDYVCANKSKDGDSSLGNIIIVAYDDFNEAFKLYNDTRSEHFITLDQDRYVSGSSEKITRRGKLTGVPWEIAKKSDLWIESDGEFYVLY